MINLSMFFKVHHFPQATGDLSHLTAGGTSYWVFERDVGHLVMNEEHQLVQAQLTSVLFEYSTKDLDIEGTTAFVSGAVL